MREFDHDLTEYLSSGLAQSKIAEATTKTLGICQGLVVSRFGLIPQPKIGDITEEFPTLAGKRNRLYDLERVTLCTNEEGTFALEGYPQKMTNLSHATTVMDFYEFLVLSNGNESVELTYKNGSATDITPASKSYPVIETGGVYNYAQAFIGNGDLAYWSQIGKFDFTIGEAGDAGYSAVPRIGEVVRIEQLDTYMVCYGTEGICMLQASTAIKGAWRIVPFKNFRGVGLKSYFAVGCKDDRHYFIGSDSNLWEIKADKSINLHGYQQFLSIGEEYSLYPTHFQDGCYIVGESDSYYYTPLGMTQLKHVSDSLIPAYGEDDFLGFPYTGEGYDEFHIVTNAIDFDNRSRKQIQAVEAQFTNDHGIECQVLWRNDFKDSYRATPWVRVNPHGYTQIPCSGVDIKIAFKGRISDEFRMHKLTAKMKYEDKTNLRGRYAY